MAQRRRDGSGTTTGSAARSAGGAKAEQAATKRASTKKSATKQAATKQAATKKSGTQQSGTQQSGTKKAATKKSATKKSATKQSATKQSATTKRATKQSAAKTSATKQAATKPSAAKQGATKQAAAPARRPAEHAAGAADRARSASAAGLQVRQDESPWTDTELAGVRDELTAEVERLRQEAAHADAEIADLLRDAGDGAGDDQADSGSKAFEREHEMTIANNTRDLLTQNAHALERIADGSYGTCESCGRPVGKRRLQAFPRATLCLECKQRQERH